MSITQIGVATVSDELIDFIKEEIKNGTIEWTDLIDTPDYAGQDGKFLKAQSGGGSSSIIWDDLPAAGLNWIVQDTNAVAEDKVGFLASGGITISLPSAPEAGTLIAVADRNNEFDTDPVTITATGGYLIEDEAELILDLRNAYVQLIFDGSKWDIAQVNHPFNIQEITEETFPGGAVEYTLSRVPPSRSSILVINGDKILPTDRYSVVGNVLSLGTAAVGNVYVRHIGTPSAARVSDTPIGAMLYFPNGEAVDGWLDCTGGSISKSVYPDLVAYLTKDPTAEIAFLPDPRGNFIRVWDHGSGLDTIAPATIPSVLNTNTWGKWLDTTKPSTSPNLWDGNNNTTTSVSFSQKYVGYRFDAPVSITNVALTTNDPISGVHTPTSAVLKCSTDGITWIDASVVNPGPFQGQTVNFTSTVGTAYRYWAVFGTGGSPYSGEPTYYWGVSSLIFTGTSINRLVGGQQDQSVGPMSNLNVGGTSVGTGAVQSGTGATAIVTGGVGTFSGGGTETRPKNQAYVLKIKAFHYQSGDLSPTNVTALINEVSRLSTQVNDGTSYVSATPPVNPSENARWYDTESGRTYIWFNDGDSYQWVDDSPQSAAQSTESINAAPVLATGSSTARQLNNRFSDITNVLDYGAFRNSTDDSKVAFDQAGPGPVFLPHGTYEVSSGDYTGNIYFSFGPVTITGGSTGITVINLLGA